MFEARISIDPEIRHGKPVIKGTRVPVDVILGSLAGGMEIEEIAKEYGIGKEDVLAEMIYLAEKHGLKTIEVPVTEIYVVGGSTLNPWRHGFGVQGEQIQI